MRSQQIARCLYPSANWMPGVQIPDFKREVGYLAFTQLADVAWRLIVERYL